jgi:anti-sigma factor RsiW
MTEEMQATLHPDDADIVRWVDGALSPDERAALETHVASCGECRRRRATFERRSARFSQLLRETDVAPLVTALRFPARDVAPVHRAGWRAAAVVLLSLGAAMAVTPVRAWVLSAAKAAWARISPASPAPQGPDAGAVSFVPVGSTITVRIPERQNAELTIEVVAGDRVSAHGGTGSAVTVLPDEVRFADEATASVEYLVRVPLRVGTIRVYVGGGNVRIFRPSVVGERWTVPLETAVPPGR